jgi:hypothetical protein
VPFTDSPFQADKIRLKECIEAFQNSPSNPLNGNKVVTKRGSVVVHLDVPSSFLPLSQVDEIRAQAHRGAFNITARSENLEFHRVTPSHRNITGPVIIQNQFLPLAVDPYPQKAGLNAAPAAIAGGAMIGFILLLVVAIKLFYKWGDRRKLKKRKDNYTRTEEWVMAPVTGACTNPVEAQNKVDGAKEETEKEAEREAAKPNRANFFQARSGGSLENWNFVLDKPSPAHFRK